MCVRVCVFFFPVSHVYRDHVKGRLAMAVTRLFFVVVVFFYLISPFIFEQEFFFFQVRSPRFGAPWCLAGYLRRVLQVGYPSIFESAARGWRPHCQSE